jgi:hypothetical protein
MRSRSTAVLLTLVTALGVTGLSAAPAQAIGSCNSTANFSYPTLPPSHLVIPVTRSGSSFTAACLLGNGNAGVAVRALQDALRRCNGQTSLAVDGIFGRLTSDAVKRVQRAHGLSQDGVYGPNTRDAMTWPILANSDGHFAGCAHF